MKSFLCTRWFAKLPTVTGLSRFRVRTFAGDDFWFEATCCLERLARIMPLFEFLEVSFREGIHSSLALPKVGIRTCGQDRRLGLTGKGAA